MQKELRQLEAERRRGWMLYMLYMARPKPLDVLSLITLLDRKNIPFSHRRMCEELDFLCGLELIRVFLADSKQELDCVQQAKLLQKYLDSDGDMGDEIFVRIRNKGIYFQEGLEDVRGIKRVN